MAGGGNNGQDQVTNSLDRAKREKQGHVQTAEMSKKAEGVVFLGLQKSEESYWGQSPLF